MVLKFSTLVTTKVKLMYIVRKLEMFLGKKAKIKYLPMQPGDIFKTHSSTSLLSKYCGYKSKTSIDNGLKNLSNGLRNIISNLFV